MKLIKKLTRFEMPNDHRHISKADAKWLVECTVLERILSCTRFSTIEKKALLCHECNMRLGAASVALKLQLATEAEALRESIGEYARAV